MPMSFVGRENEIALLAVRAMLYEVCATPKPGLVDGITTGAHQDMNIFTFIDSSIEIYPYLASCAKLGLEYDGYNLGNLFEKIRAVGIQGERAMFAVTDGVNTQKGLLFCLGILSTAVGYALRDSYRASLHAVIASLKGITNGLVDKELKKNIKR
jgi:triphosphoribosyl-dephospho-CoA synthetase